MPTPTFSDLLKCDYCGKDRVKGHKGEGCRQARKDKAWTQKPIESIDGEALDGKYCLIATSTGAELYSPEGLSTTAIFQWLIELPEARWFGFFLGYDINWMLRDLSVEHLKTLAKTNMVYWGRYRIKHIPGKQFLLTDRKLKKSITLWDMGGWAQSSFNAWINKWQAGTDADRELIKEWKAKRSAFSLEDIEAIRKYNQMELRLLIISTERTLEALRQIGVRPRFYHGPGSAASAMLSTKFKNLPLASEPIWAKEAYHGGRFEVSAIGMVPGPIYSYDIRSAYPAALSTIPCLEHGEWIHKYIGKDTVLNIWKIPGWRINPNNASKWGPYPVRTKSVHSLQYPLTNLNPRIITTTYVWGDERKAARQLPGYEEAEKHVEWISFRKDCNCPPPYAWVKEAYNARLLATDEGIKYAYKLVLNSLYGKMAQKVGRSKWKNRTLPGLITARTRAQLLTAIAQNPEAVILLATDGLLSTEPLNLPIGTGLGQWEVKEYDKCVIAQAGVYWLYDKDITLANKTRGFNASALNPELVMQCIDDRKQSRGGNPRPLSVSQHRFVGYRQALQQDKYTWLDWVDIDLLLKMVPWPRRTWGKDYPTYRATIPHPAPVLYEHSFWDIRDEWGGSGYWINDQPDGF